MWHEWIPNNLIHQVYDRCDDWKQLGQSSQNAENGLG